MDALFAAADAVAAGSARTALVIAADALRPGLGTGYEARCGAGAVAMVLRADAGPAAIGARASFARPFLDRYRGDGETDTRDVYDGRLFREEVFVPIVTEAARQLATAAGDAGGTAPGGASTASGGGTAWWSLPDPDGRLAGAVARKVGADPTTLASARAYTALGDTGAAAALLGIVGALGAPGTAYAVGYGGGRASGVAITVTAPVPGVAAAQRRARRRGPARHLRRIAARAQPAHAER